MTLAITIDTDAKTPHYDQLRAQFVALITTGQLTDGTRLPTVRALANDLGIAAGTVARTYRDLEDAGLVVAMRRRGTVVTASAATLNRAAVADAADDFVRTALAHGLSFPEIQDVIVAALSRREGGAAPATARPSLVKG